MPFRCMKLVDQYCLSFTLVLPSNLSAGGSSLCGSLNQTRGAGQRSPKGPLANGMLVCRDTHTFLLAESTTETSSDSARRPLKAAR
ncbi:hypothetical protein EJ06DRAFT_390909 [Trichodelitschia bisporula]|uniref:Uncharacterized protein n=1 Tax=Trichodelitschia bisporula TaxID=703511 RepID=A0A6G1HZB8_9PEZI|nr:hypothetical protein EJ06DRAFT_390909 [Trichodelitschia bisporula]